MKRRNFREEKCSWNILVRFIHLEKNWFQKLFLVAVRVFYDEKTFNADKNSIPILLNSQRFYIRKLDKT